MGVKQMLRNDYPVIVQGKFGIFIKRIYGFSFM